MKHPRWYNPQMYVDVFSRTQLTLLCMFLVWQLVATSSIGHYQAIVEEHAYMQKLIAIYRMALWRYLTSWHMGIYLTVRRSTLWHLDLLSNGN